MTNTSFTRLIADKQRFMPVMFTRAQSGMPPHPDYPEIDNRGYAAPYEGAVVGVAEGRTIKVSIFRMNVGDSAKLYLKSADESIVKLVGLADGLLPSAKEAEIQIQGVAGADIKKETKITVHFESLSGPVIGQLFVQVYALHTVNIVNHILTIDGRPTTAGGSAIAGTAPIANVDAVLAMAQTIWRHYGVELKEVERKNHRIKLTRANQMDEGFEVGQVLNEQRERNRINVYFIRQIGIEGTLGYGFSPEGAVEFESDFPGVVPGIILGDQSVKGGRRVDIQHWANDYAHEVGHFLTLWHPGVANEKGDQSPIEREDTWARRMLMHNFNLMNSPDVAVKSGTLAYRPRFNEVGYGMNCRGCMVTIKDLPGLKTDGEVGKLRTAIKNSGRKSIYEVVP